jgi:hypothetical protein
MSSLKRMIDLAHAHAAAEGAGDLEGTLATLEPEPFYEFHPAGRSFRASRTRGVTAISSPKSCLASWATRCTASGRSRRSRAEMQQSSCVTKSGATREYRIVGIIKFGPDSCPASVFMPVTSCCDSWSGRYGTK